MGCCIVEPLLNSRNHNRAKSQIDSDSDFSIHSSFPTLSSINDPVSIISQITMNPLLLSLWHGSLKDFKTLIQKGASPQSMELLLEKQGKNGLELLIERKNLELFKFYLPIYLLNSQNSESLQKPLMHKLILSNQIEFLQFLHSYFIYVKPPPAFNFNYIDSRTGENSALVACRGLNIDIIRFLNEECEADFTFINQKRQTALQIAVSAMEKTDFSIEIFTYLIQKCQIDICKNLQIIMLALDTEAIDLYRNELEKFGVSVEEQDMFTRYSDKEAELSSEVDITAMSSISEVDFGDFSVSILDGSQNF